MQRSVQCLLQQLLQWYSCLTNVCCHTMHPPATKPLLLAGCTTTPASTAMTTSHRYCLESSKTQQ
jgi:hypothetical protein